MAIKIVVFDDSYKCVIADVQEVVGADIGEPDCQLTDPYEFIEFDDEEEPKEYTDRLNLGMFLTNHQIINVVLAVIRF